MDSESLTSLYPARRRVFKAERGGRAEVVCEWAEEHDVLRWGLLDPARRRRAVNRERKTLFRWHARAAAGLEQQAAEEARLWLPIRGQRRW